MTTKEMPAVRAPSTPPGTFHDRPTLEGSPPEVCAKQDRVLLVRLDGMDAGRSMTLGDATCTLGRHTSNDIVLDGEGISRFHARIVWVGNAHCVEDLASSNGTYVGGKRVTRAILADGDLVQLGSQACFRYALTDAMHERLLGQLYASSTRDTASGLRNRRHFEERLHAELAYCARHSTDVGLLLLEIDGLSDLRESLGGAAWEAALRAVAQVVTRHTRAEDVVARYANEQLAVLMRSTSIASATRAAERLRLAAASTSVAAARRNVRVTFSIGCASLLECDEPTGAHLVGLADQRLDEAKHRGRNRVVGAPEP